MNIEVQTIFEDDNDAFFWYQTRGAVAPEGDEALITTQKMLSCAGKGDFYSGLYTLRSTDQGRTWSLPPEPCPSLPMVHEERGTIRSVCDVTPGFHHATGKILAIGLKITYTPDMRKAPDIPLCNETAYTVFTPGDTNCPPWRMVEMPAGFYHAGGAGCTQWIEEPDGTILLPIYFGRKDLPAARSIVLACDFDGDTLSYRAHGNELTVEEDEGRGLNEPSIARFGDRYFVTLRTDTSAYVAAGDDGLHFGEPREWTFDDGDVLGSYNTQQHWMTSRAGLFLLYTRRGANNDHVMRHRAPLFIAQVDPDRLCVIRDTERIAIPERGAGLGNFGVTYVSETESWIVASEGMRVKPEKNAKVRERGARGATFLARVTWE